MNLLSCQLLALRNTTFKITIFNYQRSTNTATTHKNKKAPLFTRGFSTKIYFTCVSYSKAESPAGEPVVVPFVAFPFTVAIKYIEFITYLLNYLSKFFLFSTYTTKTFICQELFLTIFFIKRTRNQEPNLEYIHNPNI